MLNTIYLPVSVVIPTLGGSQILQTINNLNTTNLKPREILICIPKELSYKLNFNFDNNIKIIETDLYGQVYQRTIGFKKATEDFVLQLDDDLLFSIDNIQIMLNELRHLGINNCIGPQLYDEKNKIYNYSIYNGFTKFESYIIEYFLGGAKFGKDRMGKISKSGQNFGYDIRHMKNNIQNVEWLAGGCVLFYKKNLILENYYPFQGKAYCEDLIHSYLLKKNETKLWITKSAICILDGEYLELNNAEIKKQIQAHLYFLKLINGSIFQFYIIKYYWRFRNIVTIKLYKLYKSIF